jgi:hypothetical protein
MIASSHCRGRQPVHGLNEHILDLGHASGAGNAIRNGMAVFEIEAASADERGITEAICR